MAQSMPVGESVANDHHAISTRPPHTLHPMTDEHGVRAAYDAVAGVYAALLPDTRAESPRDLAMLDAFIARVGAGGRVLDGGCGTGRITGLLADRDLRAEGLDLSPGMLARSRAARPDLPFVAGSLHALPYADDAFDGVVLWYSIIHTDPGSHGLLLREVARVLRPGGAVVVGFQVGEGARDSGAAYAEHGVEVSLVRHRLDPDRVAATLAEAGLREVDRMVRGPQGRERDDQAVLLAVALGG